MSTVRNADVIFVLHDGAIVESGTHERLILNDGLYARLYQRQFRGAADAGLLSV